VDNISSVNSNKKTVFLILVCFFLSGFTGLIYEILWTRMIVKLIGGAPFAISIILTIFMAGLGLGSYIASRTIDRIKKPCNLVRLYGILELVIGIYVLLIPLFLSLLKPVFVILYNQFFNHFLLYNFLTFIGCSVLLCVPVICMGATLPILCKFYVNKLSRIGTNAGRLYGLNTIGAALGSLICGFWLLSIWGMQVTLYFAVSINVVIGIVCLLAGLVIKKSIQQEISGTAAKTILQQETTVISEAPGSGVILYGALVIFAVSGFCSMAYEVIWAKLLGLLVGPTTYSFTIVLVTFISGLALGSMIFGYFADRTSKPVVLLICTQFAAALFALGVSQLLGNSQLFFAKLLYSFQGSFALQNLLKGVIVFVFMIFPTLCLGATFPLVSKIYTQRMANIGRSIGFAYSINTIGAVLGSFCAGFVLIPFLGKEISLSLVVSLQVICSLVIAFIILAKAGKLKLVPLTMPALVVVILCFYFPDLNRHQLSFGQYHRFTKFEEVLKKTGWLESLMKGTNILSRSQQGELIFSGDGISGFTAVKRHINPLGGYYYKLLISGKTDASSHGDMKTQTLSGHFPMLCHPAAKKIMVVGLASGVTAGEVLNYPIDQLDVLEINKDVVEASDYFLPWNSDVLSDARTNLIVQDGRAHLQLTDQKYDVIISEPSNPWMAGLATLFTKDFFELGREKLNERGIFVQWLQTYQTNWETVCLVGRTFADVFPNSIIVSTEPSSLGMDFLLVGFKDDNALSLQAAEKNLVYAQKSKNVKLPDFRTFYKLIAAEKLQDLFGPGPVNTDNNPTLEFSAPKLMYNTDTPIALRIRSIGILNKETEKVVQQLNSDIDFQIDFAEYALSVNSPFKGMVNLPKASAEQKERFYQLVEDYCKRDVIDYSLIRDSELRQRCMKAQIKHITDNIASMPDKALEYKFLGELYLKNSMLDESVESYTKSLENRPDDAESHYNLGIVYAKQGIMEQAQKHLYQAAEFNLKYSAIIHKIIGKAFLSQNKLQEAAGAFQKYLQLEPADFQTHNELGATYGRMGQFDLAIQHFSQALKLNPEFEPALQNLKRARSFKNSQ